MTAAHTPDVAHALRVARCLATAQGRAAIGAEHLLYGLLDTDCRSANRVLACVGIGPDACHALRAAVSGGVTPTDAPPTMPHTSDLDAALVYARDEVRRSPDWVNGPQPVGAAHCLIGCLAASDSVAARLLAAHHLTVASLRAALDDCYEQDVWTTLQSCPANATAPAPSAPDSRVTTRAASPTAPSGAPSEAPEGAPATPPPGPDTSAPALGAFCRDLTALARAGTLEPCVGRSDLLQRLAEVLGRRRKNAPVLVGPPGVGKTAIVEGFALAAARGALGGDVAWRVLALDLAALLAGTTMRGQLEERVQALLAELRVRPAVVLFVDEIHTLAAAGGEGAIGHLLKPALARGELRLIGATTLDEYRRHLGTDAALDRRLQVLAVDPPTAEEAVLVLEAATDAYATHHGVAIDPETPAACVRLAARYLTTRHLPDSAFDVLDEACARVAISAGVTGRRVVTADAAAEVLTRMTGIPATAMRGGTRAAALSLEADLAMQVVGQDAAVASVSRALRRVCAGFGRGTRPQGSFLFCGPTGVGKTELARALADLVFQRPSAFVRFDMSEYMEAHSVSRLIGAPPGYVGYEAGGLLTEAVRRVPYSLVLFDEIEKAHPTLFNLLLQVLEDGRLTDSQGRVVDFSNTLIILTSNLGTSGPGERSVTGFSGDCRASDTERHAVQVRGAVERTFAPEFINRLDEVVTFAPLDTPSLLRIAHSLIDSVARRLPEGAVLTATPAALAFLVARGTDPHYGARPLKRAIQREVEDRLAEYLLRHGTSPGEALHLDVGAGGVGLQVSPSRTERAG